jgi:hypothetical protein
VQGVSSGLSWKKNSQRNNLRALALSSLDDTLSGLDPSLLKYLQQFNAPNAALFVRMIEVSNVLALRELAFQHNRDPDLVNPPKVMKIDVTMSINFISTFTV